MLKMLKVVGSKNYRRGWKIVDVALAPEPPTFMQYFIVFEKVLLYLSAIN